MLTLLEPFKGPALFYLLVASYGVESIARWTTSYYPPGHPEPVRPGGKPRGKRCRPGTFRQPTQPVADGQAFRPQTRSKPCRLAEPCLT